MKKISHLKYTFVLLALISCVQEAPASSLKERAIDELRQEYKLWSRGRKAFVKKLKGYILSDQEKRDLKKVSMRSAALGAAGVAAVGGTYFYQKHQREKERKWDLAQKERKKEESQELREKIVEVYGVDEHDAQKIYDHFIQNDRVKNESNLIKGMESYKKYLGHEDAYSGKVFGILTGVNGNVQEGYYYLKRPGITPSLTGFVGRDFLGWSPMEKVVKVYKIHLMPTGKEINRVLSKIYDSHIMNEMTGMKIHINLQAISHRMPLIVIYAYDGKEQAQSLLNELCDLLNGFEGLGVTPRYNEKANDLIYFAQGNGDDKNQEQFKEHFAAPGMVYFTEKVNKKYENENYELEVSRCN